jgi:hypothetical protein
MVSYLTFVGPCIIMYFYRKTNHMHNISNVFYFGRTLYMFGMVSMSIIRNLRLHTASGICTVLDSWLWTERPSATCRVLFQNKINLRYCASGWFYYRNMISYVYCAPCYLLIPSPLVELAKEFIQALELVISLFPAQLYCTTYTELDVVLLFLLREL